MNYKEEEKENLNFSLSNHVSCLSLTIILKAFFLAFLCVVVFFTLLIVNLVIDINQFKKIVESEQLSFAYLDYIPSYNEILLYHRASVLFNDTNLKQITKSQYSQLLTHFYEDDTLLRTEEDGRYIYLKDSKMAFLYQRLYLEKNEIKYQGKLTSDNSLKGRSEFEKIMQSKEGTCKALLNYENILEEKSNQIQQEGLSIDLVEDACLKIGGGVSDNGESDSLGHYFSYIMDDYLDFAKELKQDGYIPKNRIKYLENDLMSTVVMLMSMYYDTYYLISCKLIHEDISDLFEKILFNEVCFQISELVICLLIIIIFFYFIIWTLSKNTKDLEIVVAKMNVAIEKGIQ